METNKASSERLPFVNSSIIGFSFELIGNFLNLPVFFSMICIWLLLRTSLTFNATISEIRNPQFVPMVNNNKSLGLFFAKYFSNFLMLSIFLIGSTVVIQSPFLIP